MSSYVGISVQRLLSCDLVCNPSFGRIDPIVHMPCRKWHRPFLAFIRRISSLGFLAIQKPLWVTCLNPSLFIMTYLFTLYLCKMVGLLSLRDWKPRLLGGKMLFPDVRCRMDESATVQVLRHSLRCGDALCSLLGFQGLRTPRGVGHASEDFRGQSADFPPGAVQ